MNYLSSWHGLLIFAVGIVYFTIFNSMYDLCHVFNLTGTLIISWWDSEICPTEHQRPYIVKCRCLLLIHFSHSKVHIISCHNLATCSQLRSVIRAYKVSKDWTGHSWQNTLYARNTHSPLIGMSRCFLSCAESIFIVSMSTAVIVNIQGPYFVWQLSCCHYPLWLHHACGIWAKWDLLMLWTTCQKL